MDFLRNLGGSLTSGIIRLLVTVGILMMTGLFSQTLARLSRFGPGL